jgi:hypothetical protein
VAVEVLVQLAAMEVVHNQVRVVLVFLILLAVLQLFMLVAVEVADTMVLVANQH